MTGIGSNFYDKLPPVANPTATAPNRKPRRHYSKRALAGIGVVAGIAAGLGAVEGVHAKSADAGGNHGHAKSTDVRPSLTYTARQGDTLSAIVERLTHKTDVREDVFSLEESVKINDSHPTQASVQPGDIFERQPSGDIVETKEVP